ncbi:MAG: TrkH family potassium uptake protein [Acidimicrobiia bacterium]|nr:TrkH family potassium uptake protein [Acidimicrobiia bacterium]
MLVRPDVQDFRIISYYLGRVLLVAGAFLGLPLAWALIGREWAPVSSFVLTAGAFALLGVLASSRPPGEHRLDWSHGMVVAALTWLIVPALGSLPLALSGHFGSPLDAYFDAMSGLTTTGLSLLQDLDHLAPSLNFWRHLLQFMGGQGIVLAAVSVFAGGVGLSLFYGEAREERFLPSVASTGRFIWWASVVHLLFGVVVLGSVAYFTLGFSPVRSLFHGLLVFFAGFDTGGFTPQSTSIGYYHSAVFEAATAVFMVAGAMSFGLHYALWRGPRRWSSLRNLETRTLAFTLLLTATLAFLGLAVLGVYRSVPSLARQGLFHVLSAHTGTGFATVPSSELVRWGGLAFGGVALAMALGGMASSTAGGVKSLRVGLALRMLKNQIKLVLLPDKAVISHAYFQGGAKRLTPALSQAVLLVSLLYVALYLLGAGVGLAYGYPLQDALFESVSASANVGLSVGVAAPSMPILLEVTYILQMWLGRLEFVAVFALLGFCVAAVRGK